MLLIPEHASQGKSVDSNIEVVHFSRDRAERYVALRVRLTTSYAAKSAGPMSKTTRLEECANCGRAIGRLEIPCLYKEQVVCAECRERLEGSGPELVLSRPLSDVDFANEMLADSSNATAGLAPAKIPLNYSSSRVSTSSLHKAGVTICGPRSVQACPICGSQAAPVRKAKGSTAVLIILLLLWLLPGILYLIFYNGYIWVCPSCGTKLGDAT